jgi:hypothetical protein
MWLEFKFLSDLISLKDQGAYLQPLFFIYFQGAKFQLSGLIEMKILVVNPNHNA